MFVHLVPFSMFKNLPWHNTKTSKLVRPVFIPILSWIRSLGKCGIRKALVAAMKSRESSAISLTWSVPFRYGRPETQRYPSPIVSTCSQHYMYTYSSSYSPWFTPLHFSLVLSYAHRIYSTLYVDLLHFLQAPCNSLKLVSFIFLVFFAI